jgi:hypothetical protein
MAVRKQSGSSRENRELLRTVEMENATRNSENATRRKCHQEFGHFLERGRIEGGGFDETQWDHYAKRKKANNWENGHAVHDIEARDSGHAIVQKVGVPFSLNGNWSTFSFFKTCPCRS